MLKDKQEIQKNIWLILQTEKNTKKSAVPYLQRLLNDEEKFKRMLIRCKGL